MESDCNTIHSIFFIKCPKIRLCIHSVSVQSAISYTVISFPAGVRGRNVRPETWEYRGQYFYGYKPKANSGRRQAARLLAAGLPLLLAPLLSIIFSFPVLVPVAQTTTVTTGATTLNTPLRPPWVGKRRRKRRLARYPMRHEQQQQKDKVNKMRELEVVANYLHQVMLDFDYIF